MKPITKAVLAVSLLAGAILLASPLSAQTTLRFSWWGSDSRHKATLAAIELYQSKNPGVKIDAEYGGFDGYEQKLKVQLAAGTAPDVIQIDQPWLPDLVGTKNFLLGLDKSVGVDLGTFDQTFLNDFCKFSGKVVAVPAGIYASPPFINLSADR